MEALGNKMIPSVALPEWGILKVLSIQDNHESLVPVSLSNRIRVYPAYYKMGVEGAIPECFVREQVFDRLVQVAHTLPDGIHLVVLDGWRPIAVQQYLFETLTHLIRHQKPHLDEKQLVAIARTLVSPASDHHSHPSPHLTGGSVDVTLCDEEGRMLNMGSSFDEASPLSWTAALEEQHAACKQAKKNRRLLYHAMTRAGFSNLPSEWWHYDFGNQLWSYYQCQPVAVYGTTSPESIEDLWRHPLSLTGV